MSERRSAYEIDQHTWRKTKPEAQAPASRGRAEKENPRELEKLLDEGLKDSMAASDVPAVTQPEVHTEPGRKAESGKK